MAWEVLGDTDKHRKYDGLDLLGSGLNPQGGSENPLDVNALANEVAAQYPKQKWEYDAESMSFIDPRIRSK